MPYLARTVPPGCPKGKRVPLHFLHICGPLVLALELLELREAVPCTYSLQVHKCRSAAPGGGYAAASSTGAPRTLPYSHGSAYRIERDNALPPDTGSDSPLCQPIPWGPSSPCNHATITYQIIYTPYTYISLTIMAAHITNHVKFKHHCSGYRTL